MVNRPLPAAALAILLSACAALPAAPPSPTTAPGRVGPLSVTAPVPLVVTTLADAGRGSLRQALLDANARPGEDTVTFAPGLGGTITLQSALPTITDGLVLQGPGATTLSLSGANRVRVLTVFSEAPVHILDLTVRDGRVSGEADGGGIGQLSASNVELRLTRLVVRENHADRNGGGVYGLRVTLEDSTVANNTARSGAGVFVHFLRINRSTVSGNRAQDVGAVTGYEVHLRDSTVTENRAAHTTAGLFGGEGTVGNTVLAGNAIDAVNEPNVDAVMQLHGPDSLSSSGHNLIGAALLGLWTPTDQVGAPTRPLDPRLASLTNNGGPTPVHVPHSDSPAVDAGACDADARDQRGYARTVGAACDIGAVERDAQPPAAVLSAPPVTNGPDVALTWTGAPFAYSVTRTVPSGSAEVRASGLRTFAFTDAAVLEGTWTYRVFAIDGRAAGLPSNPAVVKVDRTRPAAPTGVVKGTTVNGWYLDSAAVSFVPGADPALPDGTPGSGTVFTSGAQIYLTTGTFAASGVSRDAAGNESVPASVVVNVDASRPDVAFTNCPARVALGAGVGVNWTASDSGSGLATPASGGATLDTSTVGPKSVTVTARDKVGHETSATCVSTVVYPFGGFVGVQAPPNVNAALYPYTIVTFTLGGEYGKDIYAPGFPASRAVDCATKAPLSGWTAAYASSTTAGSVTQYDAATRRYQFAWAMTSLWSGCRELNVRTNDGVDHNVYYRR